VEFSELPFSRLFSAFSSGDESLAPFYALFPITPDALTKAASRFEWDGNRDALASTLRDYNAPFETHPAAVRNIERLRKEGAMAIVTGQQLTVLGGPLFTMYKIMTAIVQARKTEAATGKPVIPVFWMGDEDSDYDEISSIGFPSKGQWFSDTLKPGADAPFAAGFMPLGGDVSRLMDSVDEALTPSLHHDDVMGLLRQAYGSKPPESMHPQAFGELITRLFSKHGLVLVASTPALFKNLLQPTLLHYAERWNDIRDVLQAQSEAIGKVFHQQALVGDTLLFEHDPVAGRVRIDAITEEVKSRIRSNPERFSPNVFLRPILQDALLPTLAYVGGPGEVAYYAQMKGLYEVMGRNMPVILPRMSATLIEPNIRRYLDESTLAIREYHGRSEDVEAAVMRSSDAPDVDAFVQTWKDELDAIHASKGAFVADIDPTLVASAESVLKEQQNALEKLRQKLVRAIKRKEETRLRRAHQIREALFPNGNLQEREWAMIHVMNRYGIGIWDELIAAWSDAFPDTHMRIEP
jgi:bacillithiol biosynthesis cysteine-adding enzyme BshC